MTQLQDHAIFIEVPPLRVIGYYAALNTWGKDMGPAIEARKAEQGAGGNVSRTWTVIQNDVQKRLDTPLLDLEKLSSDVE